MISGAKNSGPKNSGPKNSGPKAQGRSSGTKGGASPAANRFQGDRLKELLKRKGLDQKRLAAKLEVSETTVSQWTKQKRDPGTSHLERMARYLSTSVDYLLGLTDNALPRDFDYENVPQLTALAMGYREAADDAEKELWKNAIADAILIAEAKKQQLKNR